MPFRMKKLFLSFLVLILASCGPKIFKSVWTQEIAPENYAVRFETTKGDFELEITRGLSPKAADRFYQLVKHHYFDNSIFYRVNPGFVAQFGSSDSLKYNAWNAVKVPDEKTIQSNEKGTLSFARGGKNTRTTDLFINLKNNAYLDSIDYSEVVGFPSFGKVTSGMEVLESLYDRYADTTMSSLDLMYTDRQEFLKKFPELDLIHKAYFLEK